MSFPVQFTAEPSESAVIDRRYNRPIAGATGRARAIMLALALLVGSAHPADQEAPPSPPVVPAVITGAGEFWVLGEAEKAKPHAVKMEFTVTYFDSTWNLLWGENAEGPFYLPVQGATLSIKAGQRIRWEGTVVPTAGFDGRKLRVTVLADNAWPEPVTVAGRWDDPAINARWVEFEGVVVGQIDVDITHVLYQVMAEGRLANLRLKGTGDDPVPQLTGAHIRVRAVYVGVPDASGNVQEINCWTNSRASLEVLGWLEDDARFKLPRTSIDQLETKGALPWVRLVGEVRVQEGGKSLTLRDDAGQLVIATPQPGPLPAGTTIEIVGHPVKEEMGWTLTKALYRKTGRTEASYTSGLFGPGQMPLRLRLAEQVLRLSPAQAEKRHPVTLRGIVTWADEKAPFYYVQDSSGGVAIRRNAGRGDAPAIGSSLTITGVTIRGATVAQVEPIETTVQGTLALPLSRKVNLEQALSGTEEGQRVEMRGYVRGVSDELGWTRLDLTAPTGEFTAYLALDKSLVELRSAMVRLQGVCIAAVGEKQESPGVSLWVRSREDILVDEAGSVDPFDRPLLPVSGLKQFSSAQAPNARARVAGMVLLHQPGRYLYLQDDSGGLLVLTRESREMKPGDWVDVVGAPGWAGNRLVLREAVWRDAVAGQPVAAQEIGPGKSPLDPALDARLVRLSATLRQVVTEAAQMRLGLEADGRAFDATLPLQTDWQPPTPGSQLALTGVLVQGFDEYRKPDSFRIELRRADDVVLLARPPWWNARRTLYVTGGLALVILLVFGWVMALRRRVQVQTEQIRRQLEKETRLQGELERTTRLESLGVLAGGIAHDFNNLLTAILGNLGLAAMDKRVMAAAGDCISEAERGARRARDITQQLLTFAKGGDPVRAAVLLPDVVSEAAGFARHGSNVRFEFDYPPDLPPADVDAGQVSRVVHNLVINAVQAMPDGGIVNISLRAVTVAENELPPLRPGAYILLTVSDTGRGIPAENLVRIFDPYFSTKDKAGNSGLGLATVHSIVKKHHGHITAESHVGKGTTFRIWLATAGEKVAAAVNTPRADASAPARILVMDDEDAIRRVAGRMLSLAGHETTFASDGAEAIRAYHAARQAGRPFDVVIFDLTVPGGMGGKDALEELRKTNPEVRAVASSGYSSDPVMANPAAYGFRSALPKPYDIPDLIRAVGEARRP